MCIRDRYYIQHDEAGAALALEELRRTAESLDSGFFLAWYASEAGYFAAHRGDFETARALFDQGLYWCQVVGDPSTGGFAAAWSLDARAATGDRAEAAAELDALLARANAAGSGLALTEVVTALADIALATGDITTARAYLEPAIATSGTETPPSWLAQLLRALGAARRIAGDLEGAQATLDEATELVAPQGNDWLLARIEYELALVAHARGEENAENLLHSALRRQVVHDLRPGITATLDALGALAFDAESTIEAVRCFAGADALRSATGLAARPFEAAQRAPIIASARELLGAETFDQHWTEATNLSLDELIEYVSRARGERKRPTVGWASLTPVSYTHLTLPTILRV